MFKVTITDRYIRLKGRESELLTGLAYYVRQLKEEGVSEEIIKFATNLGLGIDDEGETDDSKIEIHKIDLDGLSKEEAKKVLKEEIFDKLFD